MAIRFLVCACLCSSASATPPATAAPATTPAPVVSENMFKVKYASHVSSLDAAAVMTANAHIEGSAIPLDPAEKAMNEWYHGVSTAMQAEAKAIMDVARTARSADLASQASCSTKINAAKAKEGATATWAGQLAIYTLIVADTEGEVGPVPENLEAWKCLNSLSGADKETVIQVGLLAPLFAFFKVEADAGLNAASTLPLVSEFVSGTLADITPTTTAEKGKDTQPMYKEADAALRREMMQYMVTKLNARVPV